MAFKMKESPMKRNFGIGSPLKQNGKNNPARTGNLGENIKKGFKNIKKKIKNINLENIKKNIEVKADQIPYIGPSTSIYSTKYKANNPTRFPKATINQSGYEDIKKKYLN